jgi:hypothetical protein
MLRAVVVPFEILLEIHGIPSFPHDFPMISSFRPERFPVALCGTWNVSMVPIGMSRCGRTTMPRSMGRALNPWRSPEGNGVRAQRRVLLPSKHGSLPSDI